MASIFDMLSSFFSPEEGYKKGREQFERFWQDTMNRQQPYVNQGQEQYGPLMEAERNLLNPENLLNDWISKYEMSPMAKQDIASSNAQGMDVASQMGLLGSSTAQEGLQRTSADIMNRDRRQYLNDLMEKYLKGVGIARGIYEGGRGTAAQLGTEGASYAPNIAGAAYGEQNAPGNWLANWLKMGADVGMNMASGGGYGAAKGAMSMMNRGGGGINTNWGMA